VTDRVTVKDRVPDTFVPVEYRWAGLDRRTIVPSVIVLTLAAVFALVLPRINDAVKYNDPIKAGDVLDLDGGELTFTPALGWNLISGGRISEGPSEISIPSKTAVELQDLSFAIDVAPFTGTPAQLLNQVNKVGKKLQDRSDLGPLTKRSEITTNSGVTGVADYYTGFANQGFNAAFTYEIAGQEVGVEVISRGSNTSMTQNVQQVTAMLRSITYTPEAAT
jgi:hypothetical protein